MLMQLHANMICTYAWTYISGMLLSRPFNLDLNMVEVVFSTSVQDIVHYIYTIHNKLHLTWPKAEIIMAFPS